MISIHVPREGDDLSRLAAGDASVLFQSTSPVRGTTNIFFPNLDEVPFQSTSPVRGTTSDTKRIEYFHPYFNPRPP